MITIRMNPKTVGICAHVTVLITEPSPPFTQTAASTATPGMKTSTEPATADNVTVVINATAHPTVDNNITGNYIGYKNLNGTCIRITAIKETNEHQNSVLSYNVFPIFLSFLFRFLILFF